MVNVYFASALRNITRGEGIVELEDFEGDLSSLFQRLEAQWGPHIRARLFEGGQLRRFVNVYVDGLDVRFTGGLATSVPKNATVDLIPAVAGG